jgi:hypothetical protein
MLEMKFDETIVWACSRPPGLALGHDRRPPANVRHAAQGGHERNLAHHAMPA